MPCLLGSLAGETAGHGFCFKQGRSLRYFVSWGVSTLGKMGRRGVRRLVHKGRIVRKSPTFENLPKRKQAGLKVRSGGWTIRGVALRCKGYMRMKLRNQVVQIALRFDCRWIGQPVERCPNNQQAQQTRRGLDFHGLSRLSVHPWGCVLLAVIPVRTFCRRSCSVRLAWAARASPVPSMRETLSEMACNDNGKAVKRNGNRLRRLCATVHVSCHAPLN